MNYSRVTVMTIEKAWKKKKKKKRKEKRTIFDRIWKWVCLSYSVMSLRISAISPFMPSGLFYLNSLDRPINNRRGILVSFPYYQVLKKFLYSMQTVYTLISRHFLWRLIRICTVCQCSFCGTPDIYGLIKRTTKVYWKKQNKTKKKKKKKKKKHWKIKK